VTLAGHSHPGLRARARTGGTAVCAAATRWVRLTAAGAALVLVSLGMAGCGGSGAKSSSSHASNAADTVAPPPASATATAPGTSTGAVHQAHPQVVEPTAGQQAVAAAAPSDPVGDVNAHAPPLSQVKKELRLQLIAAPVTNATYINPLRYVTVWGRTDQGVDAGMPVDAPILAPCPVKILAIIPDWYAGQPLVYYELLNGPDAGRVQYVAEQITSIARPGSILQQGQTIARFSASGTDIEFGWSTLDGVTLARATTGYEEGQVTPAGRNIRDWLNALGANAGPS
jgi:hypothetical protein